MRKHKQEITSREEIEAILHQATVCRLGFVDDGMPYVVPVSFGYRDNRIYVHSALAGRKIEIIEKNENVCFEVDVDVEMVEGEPACKWTVRYRSVIGFGKAHLVEDPDEKRAALNVIMEHYSGKASHEYLDQVLAITAIIRIDIESMTGKRSKT